MISGPAATADPAALPPISYAYGITVTFHTRTVTGQDAYGTDEFSDAATDVPGCVFDPGVSVESVQGQDMIRTQPTLYAPAGTWAWGVDRVSIDGTSYDVDGAPSAPKSPFSGWAPGVIVRLRAVIG